MPMFDGLEASERQYLFRFLCAFAWVDGSIDEAERKFVRRLMDKANLSEAEKLDVEATLLHPPPAAEVDPSKISPANRRVFVESIRALIFVDGQVGDEEKLQFEALREALLK